VRTVCWDEPIEGLFVEVHKSTAVVVLEIEGRAPLLEIARHARRELVSLIAGKAFGPPLFGVILLVEKRSV